MTRWFQAGFLFEKHEWLSQLNGENVHNWMWGKLADRNDLGLDNNYE